MIGILETILGVVLFIVALAGIIWLRAKFPKWEVKSTDLAAAMVIVALWLLLTGKITKFKMGDLSFETIFAQAAGAEVAGQVTKVESLPVKSLRISTKGPIEKIPELMHNRSEAISFQLGAKGYEGGAIREYLALSQGPYLKHLIFNDLQGKFIALADARTLGKMFEYPSARSITADQFADWIKNNDQASLSQLPGYLEAKDAVRDTQDKKTVLEEMEKQNRDVLPVVDREGQFKGVVSRARLAASLILDIAERVGSKPQSSPAQ
ncbi:MAG: CBS domain-containing protein [candidate division FCPU426 bacterium]